MSDEKLTQEEINALLADADNPLPEQDSLLNESTAEEDTLGMSLSSTEIDTLGEIGNISFGSSATTLSTLLGQKVEITTPTVSLVKKTGKKEEFPYEHVRLQVNYIAGFNGENIFLMKANDAAIISDIMMGGDGLKSKEELSDFELSAVQEAMNQMMGASATSMSTVFDKKVDISPPIVEYKEIDKLEQVEDGFTGEAFVSVSFQIKIGGLIDSNIMQLMPLDFARTLVNQLLTSDEESETEASSVHKEKSTNDVEQMETKSTEPEGKESEAKGQTLTRQSQQFGAQTSADAKVQPASFSEFDTTNVPKNEQRNLDLLLDIPLQVTVELGRTKERLQHILELSPGSIIELDKLAGEPVDILVNQKLIAKGEVVVIDENFGVRVSDIMSQKDLLMRLN